MIDYSPLWQTMKEKGIIQYALLQKGIDNKTLDSLKNKNIAVLTPEKFCSVHPMTSFSLPSIKRFQNTGPGSVFSFLSQSIML